MFSSSKFCSPKYQKQLEGNQILNSKTKLIQIPINLTQKVSIASIQINTNSGDPRSSPRLGSWKETKSSILKPSPQSLISSSTDYSWIIIPIRMKNKGLCTESIRAI